MTPTNPTISIVVPVYNVERFLVECVESILRQTFTDFEVILVNDGSTDTSGALVDELAQRDSRIRAVHQDNQGLAGARNSGMKVARGTFLGFVDSDDWVSEEMFNILHTAIVETQADFSMCDLQRVSGHERTPQVSRIRDGFYDRNDIQTELLPAFVMDDELQGPEILAVWRCLYSREFLEAHDIWFDPIAKYSEDYLFSARVLLHAENLIYRRGSCEYFYRTNPNSISQSVKDDAWPVYEYLNESLTTLVLEAPEAVRPRNAQHQLDLHMLYMALNTGNRIARSNLRFRQGLHLLRQITESRRLDDALTRLNMPKFSLVGRLKIQALKWQSAHLYLAIDRAAMFVRELR